MPFLTRVLFPVSVIGSIAAVHAADSVYPSRPIRVVVASAPGGGLDASTRILSPKLSESMGRTWVVDNRAGAGGNAGAEIVARANANGYTVLTSTSTLLTVNPSLYQMSFRVDKDLQPITVLASGEQAVVVHPGVPAKTLAELITQRLRNPLRNSAKQPFHALTDISFDVREHEVRAIIGPNGAGKSSMLNVINGVYNPQQVM